ncbi:MAG: hypothetical protein H0W83_05200 [Planctomycetes bacterium]|nr:hypothetical protein [Planctomycetota bacterium]
MNRILAIAAICCLSLGGALHAADAVPAPAAPAPAPIGGNAEPAVNQGFLEKAVAAAGVLAEACKATGATAKLGGLVGSSTPKTDDRAQAALGLKSDLQSMHDGKKVAGDGAFAKLVLQGKDAISTRFKGVAGADTMQSAFSDGGIGKALVDATPVDKVPGYQKSLDALQSLAK